MKKNFTLTFALLLCLFYIEGNAQTQFWSDTFEDTGAPSSGTRTPSVTEFSCGGPPSTAYFKRTDLTGISLQNGTYTSFQGSKFWAAEDIDKGLTCTNLSILANQQVTWSGINISGKNGMSFKGLFAADNVGAWQGIDWNNQIPPQQDFIAFEYRINGGAWTRALMFATNIPAGNVTSSGTLQLDTNGDNVGDGASLTYTFTEYTANIVGTGTTLDIRMNCHANASTSQEIAVDNFRLFETILGVNEYDLNSKFSIYPNPSKGNFTLKSEFDAQFKIVNQLGQVVKEFHAGSGVEKNIITSDIPNGIYILSGVTSDGKKLNKKIIIN